MKKIYIMIALFMFIFSSCKNAENQKAVNSKTEKNTYNTTQKSVETTLNSTYKTTTASKTITNTYTISNNSTKNNKEYKLIDVTYKLPSSSKNYNNNFLKYLKQYYPQKYISKDYAKNISNPTISDDIWTSNTKNKKGEPSKEYPDFYVINTEKGVIITKYTGNLTTLEIPETIDGKDVIELGMCFLPKKVEKLIISKSVKRINSYFAFVTNFKRSKLKEITVNKDNTIFTDKNGVLFTKDGKKLLYLPTYHSEKYSIPNGTLEVFDIVQYGSILKKIFIPESVTKIDLHSICDVYVKISQSNKLMSSIGGNIYSKDKKILYMVTNTAKGKYIMPDSVEKCSINSLPSILKELNINNKLQEISIADFNNDGITFFKKINVNKDNKILKSIDGVLYDKSGETLLFYPHNKITKNKVFTVPDSVKKITLESINHFPSEMKLSIGRNVETIYVALPAYKDGYLDFQSDVIGYKNTNADKLAKFCDTKFISL